MSEVLANSLNGGRGHQTLLAVHGNPMVRKRKTNEDETDLANIEGTADRIAHQSPNADLRQTQAAVAWAVWDPVQAGKSSAGDECGRRPNKRKNFQPRNIPAAQTEDCDSDQELNHHFRRTILPLKRFDPTSDQADRADRAVDLSFKAVPEQESDDDSSDKMSISSQRQWEINAEWSNQDSNDENQNKHGIGSDYDQFLNENCPKNGNVRNMLSMYGLSREMVDRIESYNRDEQDSHSSSPSPSQPPTPPETPKNPGFQLSYRDPLPSSLSSENTLAALHAHMQSVLRSVGAPRSPSPTSSVSNSEASEQHRRSGSHAVHGTQVVGNSTEVLSYLQSLSMSNSLHCSSTSQVKGEMMQGSLQGRTSEGASGPLMSMAESSKSSVSSQPSVSTSVGNRIGHPANKQAGPVDYTRYVKRFSSAMECGSTYCKDLNYREHFHCVDCNTRVFVKKEEMIRHFKWHKKRDESLQHGFMRYSPMDDCSDMFSRCTHNRKQTHYHCLKDGCDKVYISTSDVQMHANYHRKDSAIMQEGFQRYRGSEDCRQQHCPFAGQHTTHFHCRRTGCLFTFKNKADMEKHKTYHAKDEQLSRDGFKKFMKTESCSYEACRFSKVCNHIHCIRPGCNYVLHSSGQLYSHKRKHERRDTEIAYRNYRMAHGGMLRIGDAESMSGMEQLQFSPDTELPPGLSATAMHQAAMAVSLQANLEQQMALGMGIALGGDHAPFQLPIGLNPHQLALFEAQRAAMEERKHLEQDGGERSPSPPPQSKVDNVRHSPDEPHQREHLGANEVRPDSPGDREDASSPEAMDLTRGNNSEERNEENSTEWRVSFSFVPQTVECRPDCLLLRKDHYHCREDDCSMVFRSSDGAKEHHENHRHQDLITTMFYVTVRHGQGRCPYSQDCQHVLKPVHYHCLWEECSEVIFSGDKPFRRLDHFKMHDYAKRVNLSESPKEIPSQSSDNFLDSMFRRKRGRPPKNRVIEMSLPSGSSNGEAPQAIYASFKLPKPTASPTRESPLPLNSSARLHSPSPSKPFPGLRTPTPVSADSKKTAEISDASVLTVPDMADCPFVQCQFSKSLHYHCVIPRCGFSTDVSDVMATHRHQPVDAFAAFGDAAECGHPRCISSKMLQHFHCLRPGCSFISVRADSVLLHDREHNLMLNTRSDSQDGRKSRTPSIGHEPRPASETEHESPLRTTVVRAAGTFYPVPTPGSSSPIPRHTESLDDSKSEFDEKPQQFGPDQSCGRPFCKLKRREHYHCHICNQAFSELERLKPHLLKHSGGILSPSIAQRSVEEDRVSEADSREEEEERNDGKAPERSTEFPASKSDEIHSLPPTPSHLAEDPYIAMGGHPLQSLSAFVTPIHPYGYMGPPFMGHHGFNPMIFGPPGQGYMLPGPPLPFPPSVLPPMPSSPMEVCPPPRKPADAPTPNPPSTPESPWDPKKIRVTSNARMLKEEPVPEGYVRFRFNEDCRYPQCGYREHQTHFHCTRVDCGYSFCDKTRFVQHTARHERLDTLMGGDFQQYRASVPCGRQGCLHIASLGSVQNKASHFHCLKCDFVCTDTNKVVAHRRQHQKQDSILAAGFEKFTPSQSCRNDTCPHNNKQTHYHCLKCSYVVLGLSQMSAHKYRHMD